MRSVCQLARQRPDPVAPGELIRGAVCGNAAPRAPRPPADLRRTAPPAGPRRVRAALQRTPAAPVAGTTTSAARARPGGRCDRPDQAHPPRPGPDQRVPQSSLTSTGKHPAQSQCASCGTAGRPRRSTTPRPPGHGEPGGLLLGGKRAAAPPTLRLLVLRHPVQPSDHDAAVRRGSTDPPAELPRALPGRVRVPVPGPWAE
jgi:hypothetical protein